MRFIPSPDFVMPAPRVQAVIYSAVEALRIVHAKAVETLDGWRDDIPRTLSKFEQECLAEGFDPFELDPDQDDFDQIACSAKLHATILQEIVGGVLPSLPDGVFRAIRDHQNENAENQTGAESACMALDLATRCLREAVKLHTEEDGQLSIVALDDDEAGELLTAAFAFCEIKHSLLSGKLDSPIGVLEAKVDTLLGRSPRRQSRQTA
jgi:hypothetical protein